MAMTGGTAKLVKTGTLNYGNYPATVKLYVYYKSTQDIANNSSTVSCGMYIVVTDGYHIGTWDDSGSYVGTTSNTFTKDVPYTGGTYWLAENKKFIVSHKSDGTGTATIYWKWGVNSPWGQMVTPSGSFTITLPTIARASSVSATNAYIGDKSTISIKRATDGFKHTLQYKISGQSSYTTMKDPDGNDYTRTAKISCPWTIPNEAYDYLSSTGKTVKITINCITYNGSTKIGSKTCVITATGRDSVLKPGTPTLTPTIVNDFNGIYIKGKSSIKLTSSKPDTKYGATVKSYIFAGPNISGSSSTYTGTSTSKTSSIIQSSGTKTYSVQVKDSRGMLSDKASVKITVHDYFVPTIKSMSLSKSENASNMTIEVRVVTTHRQIGSNAITVTMSDIGTISPTVTNSSSTTNNITTTTFTYTYSGVPLTSSGNVTATAKDSVYPSKTISKSISITPASRVLNIAKYGNGVAIGGLSTVTSSTAAGKFECNWQTSFKEGVHIDNSSQEYLMVTRRNSSDDINQDGKDETADIRVQLYVNKDGNVTCRRRYKTSNDKDFITQGFWMLRDNDFYVDDDMTVVGTLKTSKNFCITNDYSYRAYKSDDTTDVNLIKLSKNNNLIIGTIDGDDGNAAVYIGGITKNTTTSAANMRVGSSNHRIYMSSASSQRYKTNIISVQSDALSPDKLYDLPVREFKYKEGYLIDEDRLVDTSLPGFIAEEVDEIYPIACEYNEDDQPENWNIRIIVPPMLKLIQDQHEEIELLKLRVEQQQKEIEALRTEVDNMKNK